MKSKMKFAFAFIAIALMIMVAVVPMVSVFSDDSDAADIVVPESAATKKITINGKVFKFGETTTSTIPDGTMVKATYKAGNGTFTEAGKTVAGAYSLVIYAEEITDVVISVVPIAGEQFTETKYGKLMASETPYVVNFTSGYKTITGQVQYSTGENMTSKFVPAIISMNFTLKNGSDETVTIKEKSITADGVFSITALATDVTDTGMKISALVSGLDYTFACTTTSLTAQALKADYALTVYQLFVGSTAVTMEGETVTATSSSATDVKVITYFNGVTDKDGKAYFAYKWVSGSETDITFSTPVAADKLIENISSTPTSALAITTGNAIYGVTGTIGATAAIFKTGIVTLKFTYTLAGATDAKTVSKTTSIGADGKYAYWYGKEDATLKAEILADDTTFSEMSAVYLEKPITGFSPSRTSLMNLDYSSWAITDYVTLSGNIYYENGTIGGNAKDINVKVQATQSTLPIIGIDGSGNAVTDNNGKYQVLVPKGYTVTVTPQAPAQVPDCVFSITSKTFTVESSNITVENITIFDKEIISTKNLKDAAGAAIVKGAAGAPTISLATLQNGVLTEYTPVKAPELLSDGKFKFTVVGDVNKSNLYVYFGEVANTYDFAADAVAKAVKFDSTDNAYQATNNKYTVTVKDVAGTDITADLGTKFTMAVGIYEAHKDPSDVVVYRPVSALGTTATFYAKPADVTAKTIPTDGSNPAVIVGVTIANEATNYAVWDDMYTYTAQSAVCQAGYETVTGTVTMLDGKTPIQGAAVQIYRSTTAEAPSSDVVYTDKDGKFTAKSEETLAPYATTYTGAQVGVKATAYNFGTGVGAEHKFNLYSSETKQVTKFSATQDKYTITVTDADGNVVDISKDEYYVKTVITVGVESTPYVTSNGVMTAPLEKNVEYTFQVYKEAGATDTLVRNDVKIKMTDALVALDTLAVNTTEATYTIYTLDQKGNLENVTLNTDFEIKAVGTDGTTTAAVILETIPVVGTVGKYVYVMETPANLEIASYKVAGKTGTYYAGASALFTENIATLQAKLTDVTFQVVTLDGTKLGFAAATNDIQWYTVTDDGFIPGEGTKTMSNKGVITFEKADPTKDYAFIFPAINNGRLNVVPGSGTNELKDLTVTFGSPLSAYAVAINGKVYANEALIEVTATDATGEKDLAINTLSVTPATITKIYVVPAATESSNAGYGYVFADPLDVDSYDVTFVNENYKKVSSELPAVFAAESYVSFNAGYYASEATLANMNVLVYLTKGSDITNGVTATAGTEVIAGHYEGAGVMAYFIADMSNVYSAYVEIYNGDNLVAYGEVDSPSIIVVDDQYYVTNVTSADYAGHYFFIGMNNTFNGAQWQKVDIVNIGDTIALNADEQFYGMPVQLDFASEGTVVKYVFAGWYVDGELYSLDPMATYTVLGETTVAATYTAEFVPSEEIIEVEKPVMVEKEVVKTVKEFDTSAVIIGVCAVVIALIAVAYAVLCARRN